jgi:hypothetical protein
MSFAAGTRRRARSGAWLPGSRDATRPAKNLISGFPRVCFMLGRRWFGTSIWCRGFCDTLKASRCSVSPGGKTRLKATARIESCTRTVHFGPLPNALSRSAPSETGSSTVRELLTTRLPRSLLNNWSARSLGGGSVSADTAGSMVLIGQITRLL